MDIEELKKRILQLESVFRHRHVNSGIEHDDSCKQCGLDLRDEVHRSIVNPRKIGEWPLT